ncbi:MAG: MBL fold metallo-hydrolase [Proteobacteria bacterium]|nr:MBL fold metallo-hydrolase [Pseudomonadota bacterium]HQR04637.1 MBL fold metallo-hydrolase [Rhodocyclaceae bacterium]
MTPPLLVPRPSATVILARDSARGLEVFMLRRNQQAAFAADAYVFPGGALDAEDDDPFWCQIHGQPATDDANRQLKLEQGGLAYCVGAIRECFEESGLLLACDGNNRFPCLESGAEHEKFHRLRAALNQGECNFVDLCRQEGLRPALDQLAYLSRWVTPPGMSRRFDTRFFVAAAPAEQTASHDNQETVDNLWIRPADALIGQASGRLFMVYPTIVTLQFLARFETVAALLAQVRASGGIDQTTDVTPMVPRPLTERITRVTCPNPGVMTGPGTNTYLIGQGDELSLVDPGPAMEFHIDNLLKITAGRIRRIFVTHTHPDHSPAAAILKQKTGAELLGMAPPPEGPQDQTFRPDRILADGERIAIGDRTLRAIHTPGHASNHLCYLVEEEKLLLTGDHIMQGSTVVIAPPDGNMRAYLDSLQKLKALGAARLLPAHGAYMDHPDQVIDQLVAHRLARENKVVNALARQLAGSVEELLPAVYDDVPSTLHFQAARSLLAHLQKLEEDGRARLQDDRWVPV